MKTVVIIDTLWLGHVPTYHKLIVERMLVAGHRVISLSPDKSAVDSWAEKTFELHFRSRLITENVFSNDFNLHRLRPNSREWLAGLIGMNQYARALAWWRHCRAAVDAMAAKTLWSIDFVYLPGIEVNVITTALTGRFLDKLFPYKWGGLYVTPKYLRKTMVRHWYKRLLRKDRFFEAHNCLTVAVLDEGVAQRLSTIIGKNKVMVMPDITDSRSGAQDQALVNHIRHLAKGRKIIGLFGEMSARKGIKTLIDTARLAQQLQRPWFFIFLGSMNTSNNDQNELVHLEKSILTAPDNCFFSLSRIEDEAVFNDAFRLCDVIFAGYEKFFHSSNILTKAAIFRKPTLVSKGYCMHERITRFGTGLAVPEKYAGACLAGIDALLDLKDLQGAVLKPDYQTYANLHSITRLDFFLASLMIRLDHEKSVASACDRFARLVAHKD